MAPIGVVPWAALAAPPGTVLLRFTSQLCLGTRAFCEWYWNTCPWRRQECLNTEMIGWTTPLSTWTALANSLSCTQLLIKAGAAVGRAQCPALLLAAAGAVPIVRLVLAATSGAGIPLTTQPDSRNDALMCAVRERNSMYCGEGGATVIEYLIEPGFDARSRRSRCSSSPTAPPPPPAQSRRACPPPRLLRPHTRNT
jgi:hypothetical protein